jgi:RimJ/RimL family protein N-acetyltransferase
LVVERARVAPLVRLGDVIGGLACPLLREDVRVVLASAAGSGRVRLRCWSVEDAVGLNELVGSSLGHLRPWMPWVASEPLSVDGRRALIESWEADRLDGGDAVYGVFVDARPVGGCGLHRKLGPDGLEIGYWIAVAHTGHGYATEAARLLTDVAFATVGVEVVEINHDKANVASAGVPARLGFTLVAERPDEVEAPGELGVAMRVARQSRRLDSAPVVGTRILWRSSGMARSSPSSALGSPRRFSTEIGWG